MQRIPLARLLPALALVALLAFAAGCGAGDDSGDDATNTATAPGAAATGPGVTADTTPPDRANGVDRAFATLMVPHHESAVELARLARTRADSAFVRNLAGDVVRTQRAEIAVLRRADRRLAEAGVRRGTLALSDAQMGMDHDASTLRGADDFDRAFVEMMIPHHEGAIAMAQVELAKGGDRELRALAQEVVSAQQGEIDAMRTQLSELVPDGETGPRSGPEEGDHSGH